MAHRTRKSSKKKTKTRHSFRGLLQNMKWEKNKENSTLQGTGEEWKQRKGINRMKKENKRKILRNMKEVIENEKHITLWALGRENGSKTKILLTEMEDERCLENVSKNRPKDWVIWSFKNVPRKKIKTWVFRPKKYMMVVQKKKQNVHAFGRKRSVMGTDELLTGVILIKIKSLNFKIIVIKGKKKKKCLLKITKIWVKHVYTHFCW